MEKNAKGVGKVGNRETIYISFFAGLDCTGGVFRENLIWKGGWNDKMHRAAIKMAKRLGADSYALFNAMRAINVEDWEEEN